VHESVAGTKRTSRHSPRMSATRGWGDIFPDLGLRACNDNEVPLIRNTGIRRVDAERGRQRDQMILLVDQDAAQAFGDRVFV
jgi:hypothetical protein